MASCPTNNKSPSTQCFIDKLPNEVIGQIFVRLELPQRCRASEVCWRWRLIFIDGSAAMDDVSVLNLFQEQVWLKHVSRNTGSRIRCSSLNDFCFISPILRLIKIANSVKLWFFDRQFADLLLAEIATQNVRFKCLDVYPYGHVVPLNLIHYHLPNLTAMTLRPHGAQFFWNGLNVPFFPDFANLDTLLLDSINLGMDAFLPISLTTLEWSNRGSGKFADFRPKLTELVNLQYLLLGHVNFELNDQFGLFLDTVNVEKLPKLQYLIFRFCKFPSDDFANCQYSSISLPLNSIRVLKLDLCYGSLANTVQHLLDITSSQLKIVSLNQICDEFQFLELYSLVPLLSRRNISLHVGLLQKYSTTDKKPVRREQALPLPPSLFHSILWKFEASFVDDEELLATLLHCDDVDDQFIFAKEFKFVQCSGLTDQLLTSISEVLMALPFLFPLPTNLFLYLFEMCPRLKRLTISNCDRISEFGILSLVSDFHSRISPCVQLIWKQTRDHPANFFLQLVNEHRALITGLRARFMEKTFPDDAQGQRIAIYDKLKQKALFIQDYADCDMHRILGFFLPFESAEFIQY